jgi:hypothetical protein
MADISGPASVARGRVDWYSASKDDIFAAVMDPMLSDEAGRWTAGSVTAIGSPR